MIELVGEVLKEGDMSVDECRSKTFAAITPSNGMGYNLTDFFFLHDYKAEPQ